MSELREARSQLQNPATSLQHVADVQHDWRVLANPPPPPESAELRAGGWSVMTCPASFEVHYDVVDRSQLHEYRIWKLTVY
jgi:hypothetical protein